MTENTTTTVEQSAAPVGKKPLARKPKAVAPKAEAPAAKPAKAVKPAKAKKADKKTEETPKPEKGVGRVKKEGLRIPQVRILEAVSKAADGLTRSQISTNAKVDPAMQHYLGPVDPARVESQAVKEGFPSLLSLKYLKQSKQDVDGKDVILYTITKAGQNALAKLQSTK